MSSTPRPNLSRSPTWPATIRVVTDGPVVHSSERGSLSATKPKPDYALFEDDLEDHPEDHFLSPMYEYEDWASDSDDDGDEVEWDAGITDFALFDNDRRRAAETDGQIDRRWDRFMKSQRSALERAVERTRSETAIDTTKPPLPMDDVPDLTPDSSPNLRDDLDVESFHGQMASRPSVPNYLTVTVTPPSPEERTIDEDDDLPLSFYYRPARQLRHESRQLRQQTRKLQRPGLRNGRTMSGKIHSWKRPSWHIYSVGEDPEAERKAEMTANEDEGEESERGRRESR